MSRKNSYSFTVEFGDCDPAQIAFYPNFLRWYDAGTRRFFRSCGVPPWRSLEISDGIIGTPVVSVSSRYLAPTVYGDELTLISSIEEWRSKSFVVTHRLFRGTVAIAEGTEVRIFAVRHPEDASRIKAIAIPGFIRALCSEGGEQ